MSSELSTKYRKRGYQRGGAREGDDHQSNVDSLFSVCSCFQPFLTEWARYLSAQNSTWSPRRVYDKARVMTIRTQSLPPSV